MEPTDIGKRIKMLRAFLSLNQTDFAAKIGSAQNTITGYESGRRNPSRQVLALICKTFGVNLKWLETGEGEMMLPKPTDELDALARRYGMNNFEYVFFEKYLNEPQNFREQFSQLALNVMAGIADVDPLASADGSSETEDLHALLDAELEAQKKVAGESTSSNSSDGSETRGAG